MLVFALQINYTILHRVQAAWKIIVFAVYGYVLVRFIEGMQSVRHVQHGQAKSPF